MQVNQKIKFSFFIWLLSSKVELPKYVFIFIFFIGLRGLALEFRMMENLVPEKSRFKQN